MTKFEDQYYLDRYNTDSIKWDLAKKQYPFTNLLPMGIADMDFALPKEVIEPLKAEFSKHTFGYRFLKEDYLEVFKKWYFNHRSVQLNDEMISFHDGAMAAMATFLDLLLQENDGVINFEPVYPRFKEAIINLNLTYHPINLEYQNRIFNIDFKKVEKTFLHNNIKAIILCSPANPIGRIWSDDEILKLLKLCQRHQAFLIVDEVHMDLLIDNHTASSALKIALENNLADYVITIHSIGKSFGISGLNHAHLITTNKQVQEIIHNYQIKHFYKFKTYPLLVNFYAYKYGDAWLNDFKKQLSYNYHLIESELKDYFEFPFLQATYLLFINLEPYLKDLDASKYLIDNLHILGGSGLTYHQDYGSWVRINIATHSDNIKEFIKRLKTLL